MALVASVEVERVRRLIDGLRRDRRTHPRHGRGEYSRLAREVVAACAALIESECRHDVPALARRAVDLVTTALMYVDDSSGVLGEDLRALMAVHARACVAAPPDPKRLAGWLEKLRLDGPGWPDFELRDYAVALGEKGRAELARRVEDRARTAEPDVFGRTSFGIRVLREQLASFPAMSTATSRCWPRTSTRPRSTARSSTCCGTPDARMRRSVGHNEDWRSATRSTKANFVTST